MTLTSLFSVEYVGGYFDGRIDRLPPCQIAARMELPLPERAGRLSCLINVDGSVWEEPRQVAVYFFRKIEHNRVKYYSE
tara:strand:- start:3392 stop:3628 length:237 start_codon:yes stop_codon:yes gene_type:complete